MGEYDDFLSGCIGRRPVLAQLRRHQFLCCRMALVRSYGAPADEVLTKRRGARLFRTIQLYDRRPAIRGGGHDPRAADAAAVKTRLVVVAVVLL